VRVRVRVRVRARARVLHDHVHGAHLGTGGRTEGEQEEVGDLG
jgi:hypothetical protein